MCALVFDFFHNTIMDHPGFLVTILGRVRNHSDLVLPFIVCKGKDATDEFEDAGHSKTARELMEKFCIGELEETNSPVPEVEVVSKKQGLKGSPQKILELSKQYWFAPVIVVGLSVVVGYLYLRKK